jgi:hypothetical protein
MKSSSTHAEGHFRQGSKEQQGLLVKSFKLVPRPSLDKGPGTRQIKLWFSIHGIILEGNQLVQTNNKKKRALRRAQGLENQSVSHGSRLLIFSLFSFTFVAQILWEWKISYELRTLLRSHQFPHFRPILELTWLVLCIFTRWLLKWMHF